MTYLEQDPGEFRSRLSFLSEPLLGCTNYLGTSFNSFYLSIVLSANSGLPDTLQAGATDSPNYSLD
jgi:hypothetical protein